MTLSSRIDLEDGKYTYVLEGNGSQYALRYGKPWRHLAGDKFVYLLAAKVLDLDAEVKHLRDQADLLESCRPQGAQGRTEDGVAAQCAAAMHKLWDLLGVTDQTAAVLKLSGLIEAESGLREQIRRMEPVIVAAQKLVKCRGRYHTGLNYQDLVAKLAVMHVDNTQA